MTRMRFSFRSAPDQLCTRFHGSNPRDRAAQPAAGTAVAVLDGDRAVLGARHLAGVREDLPAHRLDRAARRAPDPAGPGTPAAIADPTAATGRRRRAVLARRPTWLTANQPTRPER